MVDDVVDSGFNLSAIVGLEVVNAEAVLSAAGFTPVVASEDGVAKKLTDLLDRKRVKLYVNQGRVDSYSLG